MRSMILAAALLAAGPADARDGGMPYTYARWERLPKGSQAMYIAGAIDAMLEFWEEQPAVRLSNCLNKAKMDDGQITTNIKRFASANPTLELQAGSVRTALLLYLISLCGSPYEPNAVSAR